MQITMTEALLTFLFIVLIRFLITLIKRPGLWKATGLAVLINYMYSVYMRTAGVMTIWYKWYTVLEVFLYAEQEGFVYWPISWCMGEGIRIFGTFPHFLLLGHRRMK